ncbi:Chromosome partition protein Smc [Carpediemonas membranifera]|uniref:Chromosome partition protein Smc n=1 Tax=Carpediemonas membranifera TaxID=201153 RepID=A0A8J6EBE1_9EUKA|nr:Chromosome partition protein Smc [Carpediemonas membranifera]|eukprot:KAG9396955.1 Chromosome partition protein Smc [Carpediemonas membranifera]
MSFSARRSAESPHSKARLKSPKRTPPPVSESSRGELEAAHNACHAAKVELHAATTTIEMLQKRARTVETEHTKEIDELRTALQHSSADAQTRLENANGRLTETEESYRAELKRVVVEKKGLEVEAAKVPGLEARVQELNQSLVDAATRVRQMEAQFSKAELSSEHAIDEVKNKYSARIEELSTALRDARIEMDDVRATQTSGSARLEAEQSERQRIEKKYFEARETIDEMQAVIDEIPRRISDARDESISMAQHTITELRETQARLEADKQAIELEYNRLRRQTEVHPANPVVLDQLRAQLDECEKSLSAARAEADKNRTELQRSRNDQGSLVLELQKKLQEAVERVDKMAGEKAKMEDTVQRANETAERSASRAKDASAALEALKVEYAQHKASTKTMETEVIQLRGRA